MVGCTSQEVLRLIRADGNGDRDGGARFDHYISPAAGTKIPKAPIPTVEPIASITGMARLAAT
jgi:hypothetical protein